jgi:hypothetical protein
VFAYFIKNGEDGLHLAGSTDGYRWEKLAAAPATCAHRRQGKLMRDPCIVRGPDGVYHMVWTSGWNETASATRPRRTWSTGRPARAAGDGARTGDAQRLGAGDRLGRRSGHYLIFWSSTIPGRFPQGDGVGDGKYNHRIYATTTRISPLHADRLFYDPGFSVIDATFLRAARQGLAAGEGRDALPAEEAPAAGARRPARPFGAPGAPFTPPACGPKGRPRCR